MNLLAFLDSCGHMVGARALPGRLEKLREEMSNYASVMASYRRAAAKNPNEPRPKPFDLEGLADLPDDEAVNRLCELRGVGRWTAEYVLLRGLGRTHIFPGDDVGACNNLQRWLRLTKPLDYQAVRRILSRWDDYAGLVYFHLLLDRLGEAGYLGETSPEGWVATVGES